MANATTRPEGFSWFWPHGPLASSFFAAWLLVVGAAPLFLGGGLIDSILAAGVWYVIVIGLRFLVLQIRGAVAS